MRSNFFSWRRAPLRVGWISSWNAKCGIAEYSKFLLDHIDPEGIAWTILASRNDTPLSPDAANVVRCWTDCTQPATPLLDILDHEGFDVLVIQFNFGFLALADLQTLLARARVAGTRIILMFHATADADILGTTVSLASIANSLRGVDRIFVHGSEDVARLRGFGVIDNVALFPHGYFRSNPHDRLAARADLHLPPDDLILGSYGFLLPHKGIPQLIAATALLRADDVPARLLLVNALYPIAASAELLAACREQVADLGLQDLVHFDTRFLSNAESLRSLAACDLIVYAYQGTRESSSAAVRMGIAARRPVLCSPLPIFADVDSVVRALPGTTPADIREGVRAFLADSEARRHLAERQEAWLEKYAWQNVAALLRDEILMVSRHRWRLLLLRRVSNSGRRFLRRLAYHLPPTRRILLERDAARAERDAARASLAEVRQAIPERKDPVVLPTFDAPVSQLVSEAQFHSPRFEQWRHAFRMRPGLNRKLWEYLFIVQALDHYGVRDGARVLGFGVGHERIPAVLAAVGCRVTATDHAPADHTGGWAARSLDDLLQPYAPDTDPALADQPICDRETFHRRVDFRDVDMTAIPDDLRDYDGLWSCGSLEHIGGLASGLAFIERSLACLKPGGIAVHTTEFNLSSNVVTLDTPDMSFYRQADIEALAERLRAQGHRITLNLSRGSGPIDTHVDKPPYDYSLTMNALVAGYLITSIGLIIQKADA